MITTRFLIVLASAAVLSAQSFTGYGYLGAGRTGSPSSLTSIAVPGAKSTGSSSFAFGAGFEARSRSWFGAGVEAGGINSEGAAKSLGLLSINAFVHLVPERPSRWDPFLTAGYTRLFRDLNNNAWNIGGGVNYWMHPRAAVRVEFRDHVVPVPGGTQQLWSLRLGITFR